MSYSLLFTRKVQEMLTFGDSSTLFHNRSYQEQLVMLQNSVLDLSNTFNAKPLTIEKIVKKEVEDVYLLLSNPAYTGAFASTFFEYPQAWRKYARSVSNADANLFTRAISNGLWMKYLGLSEFESHNLGEIVHTFCLICEAWLTTISNEFQFFTPATVAPAYASAFQSLDSMQVLFFGAFSPVSVGDIYSLKRHLLPNSHFEIVDIKQFLNCFAAEHYGIQFRQQNALKTTYESASQNLIMTNGLFHEFGITVDEKNEKRAVLFKEAYRLLKPGGRIVFVEHPVVDEWAVQFDVSKSIVSDESLIRDQLKKVGFINSQVSPARQFINRSKANYWIRTGEIQRTHCRVYTDDKQLFVIEAIK